MLILLLEMQPAQDCLAQPTYSEMGTQSCRARPVAGQPIIWAFFQWRLSLQDNLKA